MADFDRVDFELIKTPPEEGMRAIEYQVTKYRWDRATAMFEEISQETKPLDFDFEKALAWCRNHGFVVRRVTPRAKVARCFSLEIGLPDRVDFVAVGDDGRVLVSKFSRNGDRDIVGSSEMKEADFDLDEALKWCEAVGYVVYRWPGGARAFKGAEWSIRTRNQIKHKRAQIERESGYRKSQGDDFNYYSLDFAYVM